MRMSMHMNVVRAEKAIDMTEEVMIAAINRRARKGNPPNHARGTRQDVDMQAGRR